jgi:putative Mg2+ transporter-C (MgtC) family protein
MPVHPEPIFHWPASELLAISAARLGLAGLLGALLGVQRERVHKAAGLRTHILVGLGAALFVLAEVESGAGEDAISRVIQGVVAGIGFLGAGTILKIGERVEVYGLTTAASIWITAAVGVAAGLGHLWLASVAAVFGWFVLGPLVRFEKRAASGPPPEA